MSERDQPVHVTYADEPDFTLGLAACCMYFLWQVFVQAFYLALFNDKIKTWNYAHLLEVLLEWFVYLLALSAMVKVFIRTTNFELFPAYQNQMFLAGSLMAIGVAAGTPAAVMLGFSARFTCVGPSFSTYHVQPVEERRQSIHIFTGDGALATYDPAKDAHEEVMTF